MASGKTRRNGIVRCRTYPACACYYSHMGTQNLILSYIQSCTSGRLGMSDCGPIWQLGVIAALLLIAVVALLVMRLRARSEAQEA